MKRIVEFLTKEPSPNRASSPVEVNIRSVQINGKLWFIADDVKFAMGMSGNTLDLLTKHVDNKEQTPVTLGGMKFLAVSDIGVEQMAEAAK